MMKAAIFVAAALAAAQWSFCAYAQEAPAHAAASAAAAGKMEKLKEKKPAQDTVQRMRWGTNVIKAGIDTTTTSSVTKNEKTKSSVAKTVKESVEDKAEQLASGNPYSKIVARYAAEYGVSAALADAVMRIESNYRPNARGSQGEIGLMQIKPATARMLGYSGSTKGLYDPETNIKYGMKYLAMANDLGDGTTCGTILKYNAGHAATRMNPVSKRYCGLVQAYLG